MPYGDRTITCNKGCGTTLKFDKSYTSESGKMIPLEAETGEPHQCPNSTYNKKQGTQKTFQPTQEQLRLKDQYKEESEKQLKFADHAEQIDKILQEILIQQDLQDKKIDKILEALTITTKAEFNNASDLKTDSGNEISGSDFASGQRTYVQGRTEGEEEDNAVQDSR